MDTTINRLITARADPTTYRGLSMYRAITYGAKTSPWFQTRAEASTYGNDTWGLGNWTIEYRAAVLRDLDPN